MPAGWRAAPDQGWQAGEVLHREALDAADVPPRRGQCRWRARPRDRRCDAVASGGGIKPDEPGRFAIENRALPIPTAA